MLFWCLNRGLGSNPTSNTTTSNVHVVRLMKDFLVRTVLPLEDCSNLHSTQFEAGLFRPFVDRTWKVSVPLSAHHYYPSWKADHWFSFDPVTGDNVLLSLSFKSVSGAERY